MKLLPLVFRNLLRNRRRTILTVLSIAVSVFMFGALMSLPALFDIILRDRANSVRIITAPKTGLSYSLPASYVAKVAQVPHVEAVTGAAIFASTYRDPKDYVPAIGMDPDEIEALFPDWNIKHNEVEEMLQTRNGVLVGDRLMNGFHWHVGDNVILHGLAYPIDLQLKIVGTLSGAVPPPAVIIRQDFLDESLKRPGTVMLVFSKVDRSDSIPQVSATIDEMFSNSSAQTTTESEVGFARTMLSNYRLIFDGMQIIALVVVVTIGLVAANTASMGVRERRHEHAIMRSMGFTGPAIVLSLTLEGAVIGAVSGVLGGVISYAVLRLVPHLSRALGPIAFRINFLPSVAIEGLVAAIAVGAISSLVPAMLAARRDIATEIRAIV